MIPAVLKAVEWQLYSYLLRALPEAEEVRAIFRRALLTNQKLWNRDGKATVQGRMSGDMCTSLGNGFTNLMIMKFLAHEYNWPQCVGVVEGDDGIFRVSGQVPTTQDFESVGFEIKAELSNRLNEAGFCHIYYAPGVHENLVDPIKAVCKSGWTISKWKHCGPGKLASLSRSKALSLLCEAPTNPITSALALWIIRSTKGVREAPSWTSPNKYWDNRIRHSNVDRCVRLALQGPTQSQREFVAMKWGISVYTQLSIEKYFNNLRGIQQINHPEIIRLASLQYPWWAWVGEKFICHRPKGSPW